MYERAADFWIDLREILLYELALQNHEKPESSPLCCVYWADHQVNNLDFISLNNLLCQTTTYCLQLYMFYGCVL